jgi:outer membrane lipoprotein SlyB
MNSQDTKDTIAYLEKEAELRKKISESSAEYFNIIKNIKIYNNNINKVQELYKKQLDKILNLEKEALNLRGKDLKDKKKEILLEKEKAKLTNDEIEKLKTKIELYTKVAKETSNITKSFHILKSTSNNLVGIVTNVKKSYNNLKSWSGLFDIDKSIRVASLSMGLLNDRTSMFRDTLSKAGNNTISFGVGIKELAELQSEYSEELGRSVLLSEKQLESVAQISKGTTLGAQGAARMASDMEQQGLSAERTSEYIEDALNNASAMGLDGSRVIKNIQQNIKLLNKYNFKNGVEGLKKMALTAAKLNIDMNSVGPMADKLFDIEGAVNMSAQLQVLGGAWARLSDPFHLMYMARNDMAGLTKEIADAASESASFNKENKQFEISAMEMQRLRLVAQQTGVEFDTLATMAKNAARNLNIKKQINIGFGKDKDALNEFIENTATFDKNGKAVILLKGQSDPKLVSQLNSADEAILNSMIAEKKTLKQRADASQTFDETLTNLQNQFKQLFLPFIDAITTSFSPVVEELTKILKKPEIVEGIKSLAKTLSDKLGPVLQFIIKNPLESIGLAITGLGLFEFGKWYLNGLTLAQGFNAGTGTGKGFFSNLFGGKKTGGSTTTTPEGDTIKGDKIPNPGGFLSKGSKSLKLLGGAGGGALTGGLESIDSFAAGKNGEGIGKIIGGALGGLLGVELGPFGMMLGAQLGTMAGGFIGGLFDEDNNKSDNPLPVTSMGDGIMFNQKDKFLKMNDSTMIAGTNVNGNKDLAKAITNNQSGVMKIEFGDIHFKFDELRVVSSDGSKSVSIDLLSDSNFIRKLTTMIHSETEKVINGGKVQPK